jgi:hypothetical protein
MRKLLIIVPLIVLLVFMTGCGKTVKPKPRPINITGNWTVKNPPKPPVPKGMPKGYVPPPPTYLLTFSTNDTSDTFSMVEDTVNLQGTYILSGATIQLIPTGKNFEFDFGKTKKDDQIQGDGFVWTRVGTNNPIPTPGPSPTPTDNPQPSPTPVTPVNPTPTPVNPVPAPPPVPLPPVPRPPI